MDNTPNSFALGGIGANIDFLDLFCKNDNDPDLCSPYSNSDISCEFYDTENFISTFSNKQNFSIMSLNIQSLPAKFNEFEEFMQQLSSKNCNFDVICLQELWRLNNPDMYQLENYHELIFKSRELNVQGGGVGFYIKNSVKFKILNDISIFVDKVIETFFIEIELHKQKFIIGSVYRPNSSTANMTSTEQLAKFNDSLNFILSSIGNKKIYLLGDINIDILKFESHKPTADYINNIFSLGCLQLISKPTRCNHLSATLIDHIVTNVISSKYVTGVLANSISDHFPIFCILENLREQQKHKTFSSRNLTKNNIEQFKETLSQESWNDATENNDPQICFDLFSNKFNSLFEEKFPLKTCRFNKNIHKIENWITKGFLISRSQKNKLYSNYVQDPSVVNLNIFKKFRNMYNKLLKACKKLYFENELKKHAKNLTQTWKLLREATKSKKQKSNVVTSIKSNGETFSNPQEIATIFNNHFCTAADRIAEQIPPSDRPPDEHCKHFDCTFNSSTIPVTPLEISNSIKQLQDKKSGDMNGISSFLLKNVVQSIAQPLSHVFSRSISTGVVPTQLKIAKIVPIFKAGDPEDVDNYRPISLLCTFSKL
jgi:hypothetical protein